MCVEGYVYSHIPPVVGGLRSTLCLFPCHSWFLSFFETGSLTDVELASVVRVASPDPRQCSCLCLISAETTGVPTRTIYAKLDSLQARQALYTSSTPSLWIPLLKLYRSDMLIWGKLHPPPIYSISLFLFKYSFFRGNFTALCALVPSLLDLFLFLTFQLMESFKLHFLLRSHSCLRMLPN